MENRITYRNTDLCLISTNCLTELAKYLCHHGLWLSFVQIGDDGKWYASLYATMDFADAESCIASILNVIEMLPQSQSAIWQDCEKREFNVGIDCGTSPPSISYEFSPSILARMAACQATLGLTLYSA